MPVVTTQAAQSVQNGVGVKPKHRGRKREREKRKARLPLCRICGVKFSEAETSIRHFAICCLLGAQERRIVAHTKRNGFRFEKAAIHNSASWLIPSPSVTGYGTVTVSPKLVWEKIGSPLGLCTFGKPGWPLPSTELSSFGHLRRFWNAGTVPSIASTWMMISSVSMPPTWKRGRP